MKPMRAAFWALTMVNVVVAWSLPLIPGHDLPQHLAYARILADRDDPYVRSLYEIDTTDAYATIHRVLALIAGHASLDTALRIVYCSYALLVPLSFAWLVRAVRGPSGSHVAVLGTALVWNPVVCMGFLPFMLSLPPFLFGVACAVRFGRSRSLLDAAGLIASTLLLGVIHVVAMGFFAVFVVLLAVAAMRRFHRAAVITLAASAVVLARPSPSTALHGALPRFGFTWTSAGEKTNMLLATVFGPFPHHVRLAVELGVLIVAVVVVVHRARSVVAPREHERAFVCALALFFLLALAVPHSVREPDDLSYIDFRLFVFVFALGLAAIPPRWFALEAPRVALCASLALLTLCWTTRLALASKEIEDGAMLVRRLDKSDRLLSLSFHDRSAFFDESNGMNHYVGVYHTVFSGGVTSLFWGKFARHLPVGYRAGMEPPHPADWVPSDFTDAQVRGATHVLVAWPDQDDSRRQRRGASRLRDMKELYELACRGRYCLYSVLTQSGAMERPASASESEGNPSMHRTVGAMSAR
jgi:hypothetical protein